jgi:hypothetical protein
MSRRFQFSLRALLVGVVIIAVPFSRLASKLDEKRKERELVRAIEGRGSVTYDWQQEIMGRKYKGKTPESRGWVDDYFGRMTVVGIPEACDADLAMLAELPGVEHIELGRPNQLFHPPEPISVRLTDDGIAHLKRLKSLRFLSLNNVAVTEAGVADLQRSLPTCKVRMH